jgi:APA family basic amino acid/polyamine antiporter
MATGLRRILGLGFGLALVFGGTVGVGILRLPGQLAAALGDAHLVILCWILGGAYALLGAVSVAELAAMLPQAGGFYVYARRAFGNGIGFVVGWSDWLNQVAALAYAAITTMTFLGELWPPAAEYTRSGSVLLVGGFTALHWEGLRISSSVTRVISVLVGLAMLVLVLGCLGFAPAAARSAPLPLTAATLPLLSAGMAIALVSALRAVLLAYDGWYSCIYLAEESTDPAHTLPRSLIGGTLVVVGLYVAINVALLRALPLAALAASNFPAADAARSRLPRGGATIITVISVLTLLSLMNAILLMTPRILLAIGRDGFFTAKAATVSAGGTPRVALALTSLATVILVLSGTFEEIVALAAVLFVLLYIAAYAAVFTLRLKEPALSRPYRAWGYPYTTAIVLLGSLAMLIAQIVIDPHAGAWAATVLLICVPLYAWTARRRRVAGKPLTGLE